MKGEKPSLIPRIEDLCGQAQKNHVPVHTSFISPAELAEINGFKTPLGTELTVWGGYSQAERRIAAVYPDHYTFCTDEEKNQAFGISVIKCRNTAGKSLSHRDFLGSLMAIGIERSAVGDILVFCDQAYLFVISSMADYIITNMDKVSNCRVEYSVLSEVSENILADFMPKTVEKTVIVPSMRLDCFISEAYALSRSEATDLVKDGLARVNHITCTRPDKKVYEGDLISTTGKGRLKIGEFLGMTKKDSIRIKLLFYI